MAPSKETFCEGHLLIKPTSPVKAIAKLLWDLAISNPDNKDEVDIPNEPLNELETERLPAETTVSVLMCLAISTTLQWLTTTRLVYLVSPSPMSSTSQLQHNTVNPAPELP